ncbi:MAG TPA: sugar porter family MFS transporter [Rhodanobacteraceae bacterium]|nr:sugar porter family MFS transporter [Rhodanobacteraceae bacterium]
MADPTVADDFKLLKATLVVVLIAAIGGILYGFDIGVISGALIFLSHDIAMTTNEASLVVAAVLGGGALATLVSGPFADRFGRRLSINVSAIVFMLGTLWLVMTHGFAGVMGGRVVQGVGVGMMIIVIPMYLAETSPSLWRGRGVLAFHICVTLGILLGYLANYALRSSGDWRLMFGVALVPSLVLLAGGLVVLPESPRWLYRRGRVDAARAALLRIQRERDAALAMAEMQAVLAAERRTSGNAWRLLLGPGYRKAFLIALAIGILNQLTGINVLLQFNATILGASGAHSGILDSIGVGIANFVVTAVGMALVDKLGRRPLLIVGTVGVTIALAFMGVIHLFPVSGWVAANGMLAGFMVFIVFFAVGPGVVALLTISEILPLAIRATGMSVALFANSLASAALAAVFMSGVAVVGYGGAFLSLAFFTLLYVLVAIFLLPEAKGRTLEQIEEGFLAP